MEATRHSVDVPLSRTLVALKKVRSLRDPATNSMNKFPAVLENVNWEPVSSTIPNQIAEENEGIGSNSEANYSSRIANNRNSSCRRQSIIKVRGLDHSRSKLVHRTRRDRQRCNKKSVDSTRIKDSVKNEGEMDSYKEPTFNLTERSNATKAKKSYHGDLRKPAAAASQIGSPQISVSEPQTNRSRKSVFGGSTEGTQNRYNDTIDSSFSGCGIGYCWSGTPKYKGRNLYSDDEDQEQPLISIERTVTSYEDTAPYMGSPRSLSQKFRPKSFIELVGLSVVAQSLLYAITKGKIAPMYLFHGPHGCGKTTTARIFAAALNCLSLEEDRPCGCCRECVLLFSGKSRDVKELDATKINHKDRIRALLKSASIGPLSSRFKVFIIDECHSLQEDAWATILKSISEFSRHLIFIMVTSDLDAVPRSSVSRCQRYHFPKVKDADIICKLQKMCIVEQIEFDIDALHFIAVKSSGSLRDAETMLDQLALLGKRVTVSLVYELIGVASDDELLDLLDVALSSDTADTVRRAREIMRSRVDPLQLASQLANVIMDILAGRSGISDVGRNFVRRHACHKSQGTAAVDIMVSSRRNVVVASAAAAAAEVGMQKLRHALKVLSETEKQLRTSKNQATWLTVALLQFSNGDSTPLLEVNGSQTFSTMAYLRRRDSILGTTSPRERLESSYCYACNHTKSNCLEKHCNRKKLENIWKKVLRKCQSGSLKTFLHQEGYLSSIWILEGMAIAEVEFCHPDHVSRAAKSGQLIACALQRVLGCNVEIRIKLVPRSIKKDTKLKKLPFSLLNCSGRKQGSSDTLTDECENDESARRETSFRTYQPLSDQQLSPFLQQLHDKPLQNVHGAEAVTVIKSADDAQIVESITAEGSVLDDLQNDQRSEYSEKGFEEYQNINIHEPEIQPNCFSKTIKLRRKLFPSNSASTEFLKIQSQDKMDLAITKRSLSESNFCIHDSCALSTISSSQITFSSREEKISKDSRVKSNLLCWKSPKSQALP